MCELCESLDISIDRFVIGKVNSLQAPNSQRALSTRKAYQLRSGTEDIDLGNLQIISGKAAHARQSCKLCALIEKAVRSHSRSDLLDDQLVKCTLRWEVDGHEAVSPPFEPMRVVNRTRRLRLMWNVGETKQMEAFLVFFPRSNPLAPNSDAFSQWDKQKHHLGREIEQGKGKQALIKSWLDLCRKNHGSDCKVKVTHSREFAKLLDETYFGVIDVVDMQLKPLPKDERGRPARYAALSYVWGKLERSYMSVRSNTPTYSRHGGLELVLKDMPQAIQDAISLVQKLGLRYIWIDCLCIVQDSATSFRLNARAMHSIYGNAFFTICAADGVDASTGLVAMKANPQSKDLVQLTSEPVEGVRLLVSRPPEMVIRDSVWNTRAWTFQERILSRRCFIFAEGRAYFQCRRTAMSEDVHNEFTGSGWSLQSMGAPLRQFAEMEQRSLSFYMSSVPLFYQRQLTRPRDILAAYKGIESILQKVMRAPFCFGLPTSHLDFALLWQPLKAGKRRKAAKIERQSQCTQGEHNECTCKLEGDDLGGMEFPSWSWCGWIGGQVGYDHEALEGCLLNVREWLALRTWIQWYIRDGRGRLRPLWDRKQVEEDMSIEPRWRGYAGTFLRDDAATERFNSNDRYQDSTEDESDHDSIFNENERRETMYRSDYSERKGGENRRLAFLRRRSPPRTTAEPTYRAPVRSTLEITDEIREPGNDTYGREPSVGIYEEDSARQGSYDDQFDSWGRPNDRFYPEPHFRKDGFKKILPENPYGVAMTDFAARASVSFPDMPMLQFWTMRVSLQVIHASRIPDTGLSRCHIGDQAGDWCGSIVVNTDWILPRDGRMFNFIALSEAKAFTKEEHSVWTYYIPGERNDSNWDACYALLIEWDFEKHVWERVGLGKVFHEVFVRGAWDEIILG
jgi:hypothetical protein